MIAAMRRDLTLEFQAEAVVRRLNEALRTLNDLEAIANARGKTISRQTGLLVEKNRKLIITMKYHGEKEVQFATTFEGNLIRGTMQRKDRGYHQLRKLISWALCSGEKNPDIEFYEGTD